MCRGLDLRGLGLRLRFSEFSGLGLRASGLRV